MNEAPVAVFDSGVGGLSVLREIHQKLPQESLLYVADSAYVPYGDKPAELIRERSLRIADFLFGQGAKALVVACNTATAAAVAELRTRYPDYPVIGMEPAVKPATLASRNKTVGVLATVGTLNSAKFAALLERFGQDTRVITQPCPGLVECVEQGDLTGERPRALLQSFVAPLLEQGCDTLILGCTHYPFLRPLLMQLVPPEVAVIDTGAAVARRLKQLLLERSSLAQGLPAPTRFWSSAQGCHLADVLPCLWGEAACVELLPV